MDISDDDEDTHFCLKCHTTISGLENYVNHRKSKCGRLDKKAAEDVPVLKADDFFSSLNLQSSYKSGEPIPVKVPGVMTRSKIRVPKETGGKRKRFDEEEETEEEESDDEVPSTGGKWKPAESRQQLWPPPGHTGGKWKPTPTIIDKPELPTEDILTNESVPPPSHTRGKWGPSERPWGQLRKGNLYWCGPCNRRLSSKVIYDRHIKSELHFKRTHSSLVQQPRSKRKLTRTKIATESTLRSINRRYKTEKESKRRGGHIVCEVCRCRVWPHLMGKHLVSHYHCRHPSSKEASTALVLQYITTIVRQSPFQCGLCKFYCNTQHTFVTHWTSDMHRKNDSTFKGSYWCALCKFGTESTVDMGCHLVGEAHSEVVSLINHSVPIIIQKLTPLCCEVCNKIFRFNAQIRAHSRIWHHVQENGTASDAYQEIMKCPDCQYMAFSLTSYQKHRNIKHSAKYSFCRLCNLRFNSAEEAQAHRKTKEHIGNKETTPKCCEYCLTELPSVMALKKHLWEVHPDQNHKCLKCGEEFLLKQEVSQHIKSKACKTFESIGKEQPLREHKCRECDFSCDAESELIVHAILHKGETSEGLYPCLYCGKSFKKLSLKNHVKTHTSERPFTCSICHLSFRRRDTLARHVSRVHDMQLGFHGNFECETCPRRFTNRAALERHFATHEEEDQQHKYTCNECDQSFSKKSSLAQHQQRHFGKKFHCNQKGCIFKGRSEAELKVHIKTHSSIREYHCQQCDYSAKTKCQLLKHVKVVHGQPGTISCPHCDFKTKHGTHLKRHLRIHSGAKPYNCPHCPFTCNLLENLRKHVISSKRHPGLFLYECKNEGCEYKTNYSKEFKTHLVQDHNEESGAAAVYVTGLYQPAKDAQEIDNPLPARQKKKKVKRSVVQDNLEELVYEATEARLPTLASVALTPAKAQPEDDVIFLQVEEEYDMVVPLYHQSFSSIEQFTSQTSYDQVEIETTPDETV